jgi:hypothetical protein
MLIVQLTKGQKQGSRLYNNNTHVCVVLKASPARRLNSLQRYASRLLSVAICYRAIGLACRLAKPSSVAACKLTKTA